MGVSLLAKASVQSTYVLKVPASSRAGSLPQGVRCNPGNQCPSIRLCSSTNCWVSLCRGSRWISGVLA
ncbi:hypothetical protein C2E19_03355 [Pseudomonas sp. DTU12.3]|nr:hypothetical protein C2E19_03355 [Pseudomonas sp. DTU12.3]